MSRLGKKASVCREDVLTSRGANPRTGLITPFTPHGISQGSDDNDYVRVNRVKNECDLKIGPGERWRQDALGWSLIEWANDHPGPDISTTSSSATATAKITGREQTNGTKSCSQDVGVETTIPMKIRQYGCGEQTASSGIPEAAPGQDVQGCSPNKKLQSFSSDASSEKPFRIPRKDVGSPSWASLALTASPHQQRCSTFGHGRDNATTENKTLRSQLASAASNVHACATVPPTGQSLQCNQAIPLRAKKRYGSLGLLEHCPHQGTCVPDTFAPRVDPLSSPVNPNLKARYRRPHQLLPARLREPPTTKAGANSDNTENGLATSERKLIEKRPHFKRFQATTAVPVTHSVTYVYDSTMKKSGALPTLSPGIAALDHNVDVTEDVVSRVEKPSPIKASTRAARLAFLDVQGFGARPCQPTKSYPMGNVQQNPPSMDIHGARSKPRKVSMSERIPETTVPMNVQVSQHLGCSSATHGDEAKQARCQQTIVRHKSMSNEIELQDSVFASAREICSLVDFDRLLGQLSDMFRNAALAFRQMPWAVQTLRSQNAKLRDYLLAVRYMGMTLFYLAMLFSVFAVGLKVLKLVVDAGNCLWYPISLLLTVVRWILLQ
ncbi:MAG: hypothetical protein L6R39_000293 [Caloplaca ligustica]|nr:MAG: hypothetical protein L6R39_000293 [Caloplaca ligustica]